MRWQRVRHNLATKQQLLKYCWASLVAQTVKNPPIMQETWVLSLGWKDPLEEGLETYSTIVAWRTPEEPVGLQSMGSQRVGHEWATKHSTAQWRRNHREQTCRHGGWGEECRTDGESSIKTYTLLKRIYMLLYVKILRLQNHCRW